MKTIIKPIELLAPAKDLLCGIEAIKHGADAVYIGAPRFSARAAAGNSLEDIEQLCDYAHLFGARIYVALNTILKEEELKDAELLIHQLYNLGTDALIVQDMGISQLDIPPIPLHASTQTDNRTVEKVKFLESAGFSQVVLARELSLNEIRKIAEETSVPLEVFIHGALCVSYSGQCYLSAELSGRSANRGECAQYCRLPYTMLDANNKIICKDKHLLSLKDLNRTDNLEELLDAGVSSFKIEGRLKDVNYVKNITVWYRQKLDTILNKRHEFRRSSEGKSLLTFEPRPEKSFNRGFTSYYLHKRIPDVTSFDTPKSIGEPVGTVKEIKGNSFTVAGGRSLNNGDGLVYFNGKGELEGFRINRVEDNRVYPQTMPAVHPKMPLYRNSDQAFDKLLSKPSAERKLSVSIEFIENRFGFTLCMTDESNARVMIMEPFVKEIAKREQEDNIKQQLSKLGNTPFMASEISVQMEKNWFVPSSLLSEMRRKAVDELIVVRKIRYQRQLVKRNKNNNQFPLAGNKLTYLGNVSNSKAKSFYIKQGIKEIDPAFELEPMPDKPLMFTKHCLRYSMGWCPVYQKVQSPYEEPFYLLYKNTRLRLQFDCKVCQMLVYAEKQ